MERTGPRQMAAFEAWDQFEDAICPFCGEPVGEAEFRWYDGAAWHDKCANQMDRYTDIREEGLRLRL